MSITFYLCTECGQMMMNWMMLAVMIWLVTKSWRCLMQRLQKRLLKVTPEISEVSPSQLTLTLEISRVSPSQLLFLLNNFVRLACEHVHRLGGDPAKNARERTQRVRPSCTWYLGLGPRA